MSTQTAVIKEKSHSGLKTFLTILIIFLLAGSALGYFFKDKIISFISPKIVQLPPEVPTIPENPAPVVETPPVVEVIPPVEETPQDFINTDPYSRYIGAGCKIVSGCNGPIICTDISNTDGVNSTCEVLPEYACYKVDSARCEKQTKGSCGWSQTTTLKTCIKNASKKLTP